MKKLTPRQKQVLDFIGLYISAHKFPPTIREISERFSISIRGAYDHVTALRRKNVIRCNANRSRTIEILDNPDRDEEKFRRVPVLGTVAAGRPLLAEENLEGYLTVPEAYLKKGNYFALHVRGDSMSGAGIRNGDTAVILQQSTARNGDIVVATVDDAVTLKRFFQEKNRVKLQAENPAYPPIYSQDLRILGRLAFLMRSYD